MDAPGDHVGLGQRPRWLRTGPCHSRGVAGRRLAGAQTGAPASARLRPDIHRGSSEPEWIPSFRRPRCLPQPRVAEWAYPVGPARFLREHRITGAMFNTYEYGGYLIWALWPQQRVFIDGRALSESVFADYGRILHYADNSTGKSARELLDQYGIEVILMN